MIWNLLREPCAAWRFLTRVPLPGPATQAHDLPGAIAWFPVVGALIGLAIGGLACAAHGWWGPLPAAVLAVAGGLLLTGGFHEDAASDAADGLGGGFTTAKVLEIMRDSRIGAYGAMSLWVVLTLRTVLLWRLLEVLPPWQVALAMGLASAWGRWTAAPLLAALPPLADGLAKDITHTANSSPSRPLVIATLAVVLLTYGAWHLGVPQTLPAAGAALAATAVWWFYLRQRLGGQSGDLLGAGNQVAEAVALLALTARLSG